MARIVVLPLALALACAPGPISLDENNSTSASESTTSTDTTDSGSSADDDTSDTSDTDDPPPPTTCKASLFAIDETYDYTANDYAPPAPIVVREDGSVVAVHMTGSQNNPDFRIRAWTSDGGLIWDQLFPGLEESRADSTLAHDEAGNLYLGHRESPIASPIHLTKFFADGSGEGWSYDVGGVVGQAVQYLADMHFDADGRLLVAMHLNTGDFDTDIVVEALAPNGTEAGWHAQWDGPNDAFYSYDRVGGLAVDSASGRVFAAGFSGGQDFKMVVVAWDPPSTSPAWVVKPGATDWSDDVVDLELIASGKLVVLARRIGDAGLPIPFMLALNPDDGDLIWSADAVELGFGTAVAEPIDMALTPDGGIAVSGYARDGLEGDQSEGFLLRLTADLQPYCLNVADLGLLKPHALLGIAVGSSGQIYAGGWSFEPDFSGIDHRPLVVRWD